MLTVYDGDTLGCDLNGNGRIRRPGEMVRMLGIDAPEMHWSKKNKTGRDQPGALEALQFVERAVKGKTVTLAWDKRRIDKYGRNLAFVYPDDAGGRSTAATSLNEQLVARGLAACLFIGQNRKLEDRFYALQAQAREAGRGVWAQSSL